MSRSDNSSFVFGCRNLCVAIAAVFLYEVDGCLYSFQYLIDNRDSLLVRFFGCYRLLRESKGRKDKIYFVTMNNVFINPKLILVETYDLKVERQNISMHYY
jgi:hypothetical protein